MNLKDFIDPTSIRKYLRNPFCLDDKTIACNGHILLCIPRDNTYPELSQDMTSIISGIKAILGKFEDPDLSFINFPKLQWPERIQCLICSGEKKLTVKECPECAGSGEAYAENGYNNYYVPCKTCDEEGELKTPGGNDDCYICRGLGTMYPPDETIIIDGLRLSANYLSLIANEADIEICAIKEKHQLLFRSGVAIGCIMGCKH